ncbi:MAG: hypothetical protein LBJ36_09325 [Synergistaceae bacterium]|jgi:hypothetical protein|nr:hypothetical protein [Synergistaceae bacterium]
MNRVRNRKRVAPGPLFTAIAVLFTVIVILGVFRLQAARLEQLLHNIERDIERYTLEEDELKQIFSKQASPLQIYSYWKEKLGMDRAQQVEVIRIPGVYTATVPQPEPQRGWRSSLFSIFGFSVN